MPSQVLAQPNDDDGLEGDNEEEDEEEEEEDSDVDLPLQGTRDSAWTYLYESKGGYLITQQTRSPTTASPTSPPPNLTPFSKASLHKKSSSLDFVARLSGDSLLGLGLGSGPLEAETEKERKFRKKKSWINGANLARFTAGKGVKEMI
jgi:hypothetical protein